MLVQNKHIDQLSGIDIQFLVDQKIPENKTLEYKRELNIGKDKEKKEFLYDVAAIANTDGGCIIFGIEEEKDATGQNTGRPDKIVGIAVDSQDKLMQQIEQVINTNTDPAIYNVIPRCIVVQDKLVLVLGIGKNIGLPVMVTFNEANKYFRRRVTGRYSVDTQELSHMFLKQQELSDRIEQFRRERIEKIKNLQILPNLQVQHWVLIHVVPHSFLSRPPLELSTFGGSSIVQLMRPIRYTGWDYKFYVDGVMTLATNQPVVHSFDSLLRNGVFESYTSGLIELKNVSRPEPILCMYGDGFISEVLEKINSALTVLQRFDVDCPVSIMLTMIGIEKAVIFSQSRWGRNFTTDELLLPAVTMHTFHDDIYALLKPNFDIIWQSAGFDQSPHAGTFKAIHT
jgi:hypothetical protein